MYIHKAFSYLLINFCHLSLTFKLGSRQRKYPWHSLINSIFELLNNFMHIRLYVKSTECRSPLLSWHDSRPYKRMGIHFLVTSFKITFSGTEVIAQLTARAMDGHIMRCGTISCHFRDCKALLVTSLTRVSGAIASVQTFTFTFTLETRHFESY